MSNRKQRDKNRLTYYLLSLSAKGEVNWVPKDIPRMARIALALTNTTEEDVKYAESLPL